jgi:hypothetical protein
MKVRKLKKQEIPFGRKRDEGKQNFIMKTLYACAIPVVLKLKVQTKTFRARLTLSYQHPN